MYVLLLLCVSLLRQYFFHDDLDRSAYCFTMMGGQKRRIETMDELDRIFFIIAVISSFLQGYQEDQRDNMTHLPFHLLTI